MILVLETRLKPILCSIPFLADLDTEQCLGVVADIASELAVDTSIAKTTILYTVPSHVKGVVDKNFEAVDNSHGHFRIQHGQLP